MDHDYIVRGAAALLAAAMVLLGCQLARGAAPCPDADPQKVTDGKAAPCTGWAISEADALHTAKMKADLRAERKAHASERKAHETTKQESVLRQEAAAGKLSACDTRVGALESALDDCDKLTTPAVPWYETPEFVAPVSAAAAIVVTVLVVVLAYEVSNG